MEMSVSDPILLLDGISTMLDASGDIERPADVPAVINLIRNAKKLLVEYYLLQERMPGYIGALEDVNQFVTDSGCTILNKWLADAKGLENPRLILEGLELILTRIVPYTIEDLEQGNIDKLLKQLTKSEEKDIKERASSLLNKWMILVKEDFGKPKKSEESEEQSEGTVSNTTGSPTIKRSSRDNSTSSKSGQPPEKKTKIKPDRGLSLTPAIAALLANTSQGPGNPTSNVAGSGNNPALANVVVQAFRKTLMDLLGQEGLQDPASQSELGGLRFPSSLTSQNLRMPGRGPGDQGPRGIAPEPLRRGLSDYRPRGLLRTPGPHDHPRFPGPHHAGPLRGQFRPSGGPRLLRGQRMPGPPMGRGGMPNRFPGPEGNRNSGEEFYNDQYNFSEGDNPDGLGRGLAPWGRGTRGRGRGRPTCCHFMSSGGCLRGNSCKFLHPGVNGSPTCRHFMSPGGCLLGNSCKFLHPGVNASPTCRHFMSPRGCLLGNSCKFLHAGVNGSPG